MADLQPERVAKLMAGRGLCSRREAERLIDAGCVLLDGEPVLAQGAKAAPTADIRITDAGQRLLGGRATVLLHKPLGIVSTQPEPGQTPAWQLVRASARRGAIEAAVARSLVADPQSLSVAGRLDRASRGLLILTQDGTVARRIIGGQGVEKEYLVRTDAPATDGQLRKLNGPMHLDGQPLLPMRVSRVDSQTLRFVLVEGKKHQIRRCARTVGLSVVDLFRVAVGPLVLGDLPEGCWRVATAEEIAALQRDGRVESDQGKRQKAKGRRQKGGRGSV
ncbi:MAG TPA: pseudouridine synthase [Candidatus Dormibacteraeota bacterium]|nr:pseudouridine synthase [Candidatus Dormibacteraeota bacterium]